MSQWTILQNGSDIRGVALDGVAGEPITLTEPICRTLGFAFAQWLVKKSEKPATALTIGVGNDSRLSGPAVKAGVANGIAQAGGTMIDCGLASTPAMFMSTQFDNHQYDGAIMLTASHLPFNRNGMKFFISDGGLEKSDIAEIIAIAEATGELAETKINEPESADLMSDYAEHLCSIIREKTGEKTPLSGLKIVVDAGNGAGGYFVDKVLQPLGADTAGSQFLDPDGRFPNHIPNPEDAEAMDAIIRATLDNHADFGIIFDTDVDRAGAVDKNGKPINRNRFIALMASIVLEEHPNSTIVTDSVTSTGVKWWIEEKLGGVHHRFKRGYRNVINESMRLNDNGTESWLAMETSGHGALKENYFLDDGAYQIAKILIKIAQLKSTGHTINELIEALPEPQESEEIRIKINTPEFGEYGDRILATIKAKAEANAGWTLTPNNFEGVHISCAEEQGWILIRKSLHDPVLPINVESDIVGGTEAIWEKAKALLSPFDQISIPK